MVIAEAWAKGWWESRTQETSKKEGGPNSGAVFFNYASIIEQLLICSLSVLSV